MKTSLKLFNTATKKLESLDLAKPIGLYVCGITPYDTTHIGHAFTYLSFDLLIRYLKFLGVKVRYVQNVTDIDDDILLRAKAVGKNWQDLGTEQTESFLADMLNLNWVKPNHYVKATANIPKMIQLIKKLLAKGYAYEKRGSV